MLYRIFRFHPQSGAYVLQSTRRVNANIEVKGNSVAAAVEWAKLCAPPTAEELDLLVASLGPNSITELRRVCLRRVPSPQWKHVRPPEMDFDLEEID